VTKYREEITDLAKTRQVAKFDISCISKYSRETKKLHQLIVEEEYIEKYAEYTEFLTYQ